MPSYTFKVKIRKTCGDDGYMLFDVSTWGKNLKEARMNVELLTYRRQYPKEITYVRGSMLQDYAVRTICDYK